MRSHEYPRLITTRNVCAASSVGLKMGGKSVHKFALDETLKSPEGLSIIACLDIIVEIDSKQEMVSTH